MTKVISDVSMALDRYATAPYVCAETPPRPRRSLPTSPEQPAPRVALLFHFEDAAPDSPFVDRVWRMRSERAQSFLSVATAHWELVFSREEGGGCP